ncbi:hypothetical protein ACIQ1D_19155 [Lysinibacillus xylanilyticus]|uniref:hypothetical protein n=1 Tax=Lysinibacillus xylanilyticus TaxID=582475 RepID=UPI00380A313F
MITFLIQYQDEKTITKLEDFGDITYRSPIMRVVGLTTEKSIAEILKVEGVIFAEKERKKERRGRLCI